MSNFVKYGCKPQNNRVGILLAQLGTPDAPTASALRPYLKQFLSDRRVIEVNRVLWWCILNGIILRTRPKRSAALYKRLWTPEGSPLLSITKSQTQKLSELFASDENVTVRFGMRYGKPSLESALDELIALDCRRIIVMPMYPQYAASTTASTYDAVFPHLLKQRWVPTLRIVEPYFSQPAYVDALTGSINKNLADLAEPVEKLLLSYHGVPIEYIQKGDPYCCQCRETTELLRPQINLAPENIVHCYQSRFGKAPWLTPYTDVTAEELGKQGIKRIAVACPGFTADCLETIDEMGHELEETFTEHGGESVSLIPCLNDDAEWIQGMATIIKQTAPDWFDAGSGSGSCATVGACRACSAGCFAR
jgi:protoporphyrin/coproporphyrin ferrochelatase